MPIEINWKVLQAVIEFLRPILGLGDEDVFVVLMQELGWDSAALGIGDSTALQPATEALGDSMQAVYNLLDREEVELSDLVTALSSLANSIVRTIGLISSLPHAEGVPADALTSFGEDLIGFLVEQYLTFYWPRSAIFLEYLGVLRTIELPEIERSDGVVLREPSQRRKIDLSAVMLAIRDPLNYVRQEFLLGSNGVRRSAVEVADLVGPRLADALINMGLTAGYGIIPMPQPDPALEPDEAEAAKRLLVIDGSYLNESGTRTSLRVVVTLSDEPEPEGLSLVVITSGDVSVSFPLANGTLSLTLEGALEPLLISAHSMTLASGAGEAQFVVEAQFVTDPAASPALRFGSAGGTHFEVGQIQAGLRLGTDSAGVDFGGALDLKDLLLAIQGGDGDGFLGKVLPQEPIVLRADVGFDASLRKGFSFRGGAGLEVTLPIHQSFLNTITADSIYLALLAEEGRLETALAASLTIRLGPIAAAVERIGLTAGLRFPGGARFELQLGFKPPNGVGLAISAAGITGGGFLSFDYDNQRYSGVLVLSFGQIGLTALGLITTKMPDGSEGFALLINLCTTFKPPIQLAMGFTLSGIGGLLAVNRSLNVDALRAGIRNRLLDAILFPDPSTLIANAPAIISNLETAFPAHEGRYVVGPMVKIGWGSPNILTADVGIFLEFPQPVRVILMGQVQAALPTVDKPLIEIHLDVLGVLDFDKQELTFQASLYDSHILSFALSGDAAFLLGWGSDPRFALSLGGFHPKFTPPPPAVVFADLRRLTLSIGTGNAFQLACRAYQALTPNSLQFGAQVDLHAAEAGLEVSGYLGFDALFIFSPFSFEVEIRGGVHLSYKGLSLLGVDLALLLSGPTPWHARGTARIKILFFSIKVGFSYTWGSDEQPPLPPVDPWEPLQVALRTPSNWGSALPTGSTLVESLRPIEGERPAVVVHPAGRLEVRQNVVPLGVAIQKFGTAPVSGHNAFTIDDLTVDLTVGGESLNPEPVEEFFARGQFEELTGDQKLSLPSFEKMVGGVITAASGAVCFDGGPEPKSVAYDSILEKSDGTSQRQATAGTLQWHEARRAIAATARQPGVRGRPRPAHPPGRVVEERYCLANAVDLTRAAVSIPLHGENRNMTRMAADQAFKALCQIHPEEAGGLLVLPECEVAA